MGTAQLYKSFLNEKKQALGKKDKSSKGKIDKKIKDLINLINSNPFLYTTSSCSGRILIMKEKGKKERKVILKSWHDKIEVRDLVNFLKKIREKDIIYFKFEPFILHIISFDYDLAAKIVSLARNIGFKRSGFYYGKRRWAIIEIRGNDILAVPIYKNKILIDEKNLEIIINETNKKIDRNYEKIKKFKEKIKSLLYLNKNII
ncbi:MAG: hypothetical protein QXM27_00840 [Candidatus Pacearchaeota archaeon]